MNDRIKQLRKALDLTQKAFATRIGMKSNTIATYEMGRAVPSEPAINNICKEFGVNRDWLVNGVGEMFAPKPSNALNALAQEHGLSHDDCVVIENFLNLKPEVRTSLIEYFKKVSSALTDTENADAPDPSVCTAASIVESDSKTPRLCG